MKTRLFLVTSYWYFSIGIYWYWEIQHVLSNGVCPTPLLGESHIATAPCILLKSDLFFSFAFNFAHVILLHVSSWKLTFSFLLHSILPFLDACILLKIDLFFSIPFWKLIFSLFFPFDFALFRCASQRACWNSSKHSIMSKTWFNSALNAKLNKNCFWLRKTQPWQRWNTFIGRSQFYLLQVFGRSQF